MGLDQMVKGQILVEVVVDAKMRLKKFIKKTLAEMDAAISELNFELNLYLDDKEQICVTADETGNKLKFAVKRKE